MNTEQMNARAEGYRWTAMNGSWGAKAEATRRYPTAPALQAAFVEGVHRFNNASARRTPAI